jgi:Mrp family chromosome partitioning ATPase
VTDDLGEQALATHYDFDIGQMNKMDAAISDLDVEIALGKAAGEARPDAKPHEMTAQEIAIRDPAMEQLLEQKSALESRKTLLSVHDGLGPKHPEMVTVVAALEAVDGRIADRAEAYRGVNEPQSPDKLRETELRRARLAELREKLQADAALANLDQERTLQTQRLDEVRKRLEQINVESETHGRISVVAYGDRPVEPDTDRRIPLAVLGGFGGMGLGFGGVVLWGLREAKVRHMVDVDHRSTRCRFLGVVPEIRDGARGADADDPAAVGDFCVHHLRALLQLRSEDRARVIGVTSPTPAAGKTTLTLALGMSFAASGARTLLVDCDFVGHGLTSTMRSLVCEGATRALTSGRAGAGAEPARGLMAGLIEARRLEFGDAHVRELVDELRRRSRSGDDSFARTASALEALARPGAAAGPRRRRGIDAMLAGSPVERSVVDTCVPNLSLLPVGDLCADDAERVSRADLHRLIESCRDQFDTVLVDTGPVLGSLETILVAAAVDDVLLVVSRGERRPRVDESLARLSQVGADVAGTVFNRATTADVAASSYASRSQSRPMEAA